MQQCLQFKHATIGHACGEVGDVEVSQDIGGHDRCLNLEIKLVVQFRMGFNSKAQTLFPGPMLPRLSRPSALP